MHGSKRFQWWQSWIGRLIKPCSQLLEPFLIGSAARWEQEPTSLQALPQGSKVPRYGVLRVSIRNRNYNCSFGYIPYSWVLGPYKALLASRALRSRPLLHKVPFVGP